MPKPCSLELRERVVDAVESGASRREAAAASKKSLRAAEQERADVARARRRWMQEQGMFDPARLVFLDETATSTNMVRLRGRCPRGQRLIAHVPHGHWKTITFVAGLRRRAVVAPLVLDGPMNATMFVTYLKRMSCSQTQARRRCDHGQSSGPQGCRSTRSHRRSRSETALSSQIFPGSQPIEQAFSKLKAHLRKAAERTIPRLSRRIATLVAAFSRQECTNYFRHAGYASR